MLVWRRGRAVAFARRDEGAVPLDVFIASLDKPGAPVRRPGTAIYLSKQTEVVPAALALNVKHNDVVHDRVVLLQIITSRAPRVAEADRITVQELPAGFSQVEIHFGFAEKPDISAALAAHHEVVGCDPATSSFFLGREDPVPSLRPDLAPWQEQIYAFLVRNAVRAPDYFLIPPDRVVELGTKVEM